MIACRTHITALVLLGLSFSALSGAETLSTWKVVDVVVDVDQVELALAEPVPQSGKRPCVLIRALVTAMQEGQPEDARFEDFGLQVQEFKARPERLNNGKWINVDRQQALEVLAAAADFAEEIAPAENRNTVTTMPLPTRRDGAWDQRASHPKLAGKPQPGSQPLLFRYLDFAVKPGYWYRYRVQLVAIDASKEERAYLTTAWSEPSALIAIPPSKPTP